MSTKWLKAKWWSWLARRNAKRGDYRSALIYAHRLLSAYPNWSSVHSYIGYCHTELEQYDEAAHAFDQALQIRPNSGYARAQLGRATVMLGRYQQGIDDLNRAFRMEPKLREQYNYQVALAHAWTKLGRIQEALEAHKEQVRFHPQSADAHYGVGWALFSLESFKEAESSLRTAITLDPDHVDANDHLGRVLLALGKSKEAREQLEKSVRLKADDPGTRYSLAYAYYDEKRFDESAAACLKAIELRPDYAEAYNHLAVTY
jgi:protein O-GlcNAc transferase